MFAILLNIDNLPKIIQRIPDSDTGDSLVPTYLNSSRRWYVVTGYVTRSGKYFDWTIIPAYVIETHFEYDKDKIKTDWDQIVRK